MRSRNRLMITLGAVLTTLALAGTALVVHQEFFAPRTITAYFTSATAIYPGDQVEVSGVKVGTVSGIRPDGDHVAMTLRVDRDVQLPANVRAVIVAQNLVSARYVQLAPAYRSSGPTMPDGAAIPLDRTAVPVEWDEVKAQLMRLATDLGPNANLSTTSTGRFISSAADAMAGNGEKLRKTLAELSGVGRILANGSGNIVDIIRNLETFVAALRDSGTQIVEFERRLATLTSVVDDSKSNLDAALKDLAVALGDVQRFIGQTRDGLSEQVQRLADVTQNLADHRRDLEQILHVTPNAIANGYNTYNPITGDPVGALSFQNFANPIQFICASIGAIKNVTASETGKLCAEYLGPALRVMNFNYVPVPLNYVLMPSPGAGDLSYTDPTLAPGGAGPAPTAPEIPPAVSAYTGLPGDIAPGSPPPPPPRVPGLAQFQPPPTTAQSPPPTTLPEVLLPGGGPTQ
jgi:phospholipid/cholesterol/gamma-HCH transport system substrate-binding protein